VAPPSNENENYVVHPKEQSILKKALEPYEYRSINHHTILVWTMSPTRNHTKRDIQKHQFSLVQPAPVVRCPPNCKRKENIMTILKGANYFSIQSIVFPARTKNADLSPLAQWVNLVPAGCHGNLPVNTHKTNTTFSHLQPARLLSQTHRQDRLQYTALQLASAQCNERMWHFRG